MPANLEDGVRDRRSDTIQDPPRLVHVVVIVLLYFVSAWILTSFLSSYISSTDTSAREQTQLTTRSTDSTDERVPLSPSQKRNVIQAVAVLLAGLAGSIGVYFAWKTLLNSQLTLQQTSRDTRDTLQVSREGQITDRYIRAIDQLGAVTEKSNGEVVKQLERRIGGIYGLGRVAQDGAKEHSAVMEVLSAYVRTHSPATFEELSTRTPELDIQAVLNVLKRHSSAEGIEDKHYLDLTRTNLVGADLSDGVLNGCRLSGSNLNRVNLLGAHLENADLTRAHLERAQLGEEAEPARGANLQRARLNHANLFRANLRYARLGGAELKNTKLQKAYVQYANLTDAICTGAQMQNARFHRAKLERTQLIGANLTGATLQHAQLQDTDFMDAQLQNADLRNTDLRSAKNLTEEQITLAITDNSTLLPPAG